MHLMSFKSIKWPEDVRDPEKVLNNELAYYECPACGSCWTNLKRDAAARFGRWVAMEKSRDGEKEIEGTGLELFEYLKKYNPRKIGFHIPSWVSPFVTLSEVAAAFLKGLKDRYLHPGPGIEGSRGFDRPCPAYRLETVRLHKRGAREVRSSEYSLTFS
jgi:hypothetical protein